MFRTISIPFFQVDKRARKSEINKKFFNDDLTWVERTNLWIAATTIFKNVSKKEASKIMLELEVQAPTSPNETEMNERP